MNIELDVYDADLQNVSSGDNVDPALGLKLKVYGDPDANGDTQLATILLACRPEMNDGVLTLTIYRDVNFPLAIQTVDYFNADGSPNYRPDPYYNVLRDR